MKRKLLSLLALLMTAATGAVAQNYTITLPSVSNGSVVAKVSDVSVTSAAEGATVSLVATPDAGYKLKTISGTYQGGPEETLSKGAATRTGSYFTLTASLNNNAGWNLYTSSTITITSNDTGRNINQVVLNITPKNKFVFDEMSVNHGSMTRSGNVITITGINSNSVVITGTSNLSAYGCTVNSATITGSGLVDKTLTLTATGDANVKTFTMPSSNVTISAEFELAPINVTANEGATNEYWATFFSNASNYQASAGTQVFKVKLTGSAIEMTEITDRIVKSGQGVVLKKTTSGSITMTPTSSNSSDDYSGNSLTGTMTNITNPGNAYVLNYKAATGAGFYKLSSGGTIGANKAYLEYDGSAGARGFFGFDEATGIESLSVNECFENGEVYDLQGRRVVNPTKGLYIVNGKKVFINK